MNSMSIVEALHDGSANKRDIVLALMLWVIGALLSVAMSVSATKLPQISVIDISSGSGTMTSSLVCRIPVPAGQFSVMLPSVTKVALSEDTRTIVLKLPSDLGFSGLGISVELSPQVYEVIAPSMTQLRKRSFNSRILNDAFILNAPFTAKKVKSFEPVISKGQMGFIARLEGDNVDKLYIELYKDTRRMIFEIAVAKGMLTSKHRDLLYAVVASVEDFKGI